MCELKVHGKGKEEWASYRPQARGLNCGLHLQDCQEMFKFNFQELYVLSLESKNQIKLKN